MKTKFLVWVALITIPLAVAFAATPYVGWQGGKYLITTHPTEIYCVRGERE